MIEFIELVKNIEPVSSKEDRLEIWNEISVIPYFSDNYAEDIIINNFTIPDNILFGRTLENHALFTNLIKKGFNIMTIELFLMRNEYKPTKSFIQISKSYWKEAFIGENRILPFWFICMYPDISLTILTNKNIKHNTDINYFKNSVYDFKMDNKLECSF
mgnify:FL=1